MKKIAMIAVGPYTTATILVSVLGLPQSRERGISAGEMRTRMKLADKVEAAEGGNKALLLEDADYEMLKGIVENHQFALANKELLKVLDGILTAETVTVAEVANDKAA